MISGKSFILIILMIATCRLSVLEEEWQLNLAEKARILSLSPSIEELFEYLMEYRMFPPPLSPALVQLEEKLSGKFKTRRHELKTEKRMDLALELIQSTLDDRFGDLDKIEK